MGSTSKSATTPTRSMKEDKDVKELYQKFRTLIASSKCEEEFTRSLQCSVTGRGSRDSYCSERRREGQACQTECREVEKVKAKAEAQDEAILAQQSNPLSACLPEGSTRRRLQSHERYADSKGRKMLELTDDEQKYYDIYLKIKDNKIECDKKFMAKIATLLDNGGVDILSKIQQAASTIKAT